MQVKGTLEKTLEQKVEKSKSRFLIKGTNYSAGTSLSQYKNHTTGALVSTEIG